MLIMFSAFALIGPRGSSGEDVPSMDLVIMKNQWWPCCNVWPLTLLLKLQKTTSLRPFTISFSHLPQTTQKQPNCNGS
ncbi:hypothetical protein DPMN_116731 [Dreissena polymorpha]|uniref:Secreted protein n=1 Tax=Dreissena polymorpha TaxID=45954 RepID=A0A9D4KP77_DREPO|nr:hypothetical protein DPMN_116731 [Dreissena polymorpha]